MYNKVIFKTYTIVNKIFSSILGNYFCPVCNKKVINFIPLPAHFQKSLKKYGFKYNNDAAETLNYERYSCPHCNASDRDRLYSIYIQKRVVEQKNDKVISMLEIAPSKPLDEMMQRIGKISLRTADLMMEGVDDVADIMDMTCYGSCAFDAFICSHVLEHVTDDFKALRELYRVLNIGGWGILMVPICLDVDLIDEDPSIVAIEERWRRFGQDDHVRLYSKNGFIERVKSVGFTVHQFGQDYFGSEVFNRYGISKKSVLYVVAK